MRRPSAALLAVASALGAVAAAETVITFRQGVSPTSGYSGSRDVLLTDGADFFWEPDRNYNGMDEVVVDGSPQDQVGLFRWDISGFIPTGATVDSASIVLVAESGTANTYEVYECLQDWVDSEATWNQYRLLPDGGPARWVLPGAQAAADGGTGPFDRGGVVLGGATGTGTITVPLNPDGVAMVQRWVSTPSTNRGVVMFDLSAGDDLVVRSEEHTTSSSRPRLRVYFDGNPVPIEFASRATPSASYTGGKDTFLAFGADPQTVNWNSLDNAVDGDSQREATLMSWSLAAIPPWSTVRGARFELFVTNNSNEVYPVYQALRPWTELTATWLTTDGVVPWGAPGADSPGVDHGVTPLAFLGTPLVDTLVPFDLTPAGVQVVQDWVSGAQPNHGFLAKAYVYPDGGRYSDSLDWENRSNSTLMERPAFSVRYTEGDLTLAPAPGPLGTGASSSAFVVRRGRPDGGAPLAQGLPLLRMELSSSSDAGEFSGDWDPEGTWTPRYAVTIAADASVSAPVYYRDRELGLAALSADAGPTWDAVPALVPVLPEALVDDFESPGLLVTDTPAGPWTGSVQRQTATIAIDPAAAHRGSAGLRVTDPDSVGTQGAVTELAFSMAPRAGDFHARAWIRVSPTIAAGSFNPLEVLNSQASAVAMAEVILDLATGAIALGGDDRAGYITDATSASLVPGRWTLFELAVDGAGGAPGAGRRRLWVDGQLAADRAGLDFSGAPWMVQEVEVGQPWSDDRSFTGTIDFDDVRLSTRPQVSHSVAQVPAGSYQVGSCIPVTLTLRDSASGGAWPSFEPVDLAPAASGVAGAFFSSSTCAGAPLGALSLPAGQTGGTVYFRADGYGTAVFRADSADLVPFPSAQVTVLPGALPDHARVRAVGPSTGDTCSLLQVEASVVDSTGAVVAGAVDVSVCADPASSAVVQATTLGGAMTGGRCATGLTGAAGTGTVDFTSTVAGTATVTATRAGLPGAPVTASLTWRPGSVSAAHSELLVEGAGPVLVPGGAAVPVRVVPRDVCGGATSVRLVDVALVAPDGLHVGPGVVQVDGSVVFQVSLPVCPAEGALTFTLRARISGADVEGGTGQPVEHTLTASCLAPRFTSTPPSLAECGSELQYLPVVEGPGPLQFQLQAAGAAPLPAGLAADPATGEIRWTPAAADKGTVSADLVAVAPGGTATQRLEVAVQCEPRQLEALCGCRSGGGGTTPALALLLALAWRARKKRRAPAGERS
jgi:hypothetical protein